MAEISRETVLKIWKGMEGTRKRSGLFEEGVHSIF